MNCKQGDLAIIVHGDCHGCTGYVVRCIAWLGEDYGSTLDTREVNRISDAWRVEVLSRDQRFNDHEVAISDRALRPIRGTPETEDIDHKEPVEA